MKMKVYTSYKDVDKDLRILNLRAEIKKEEIKLQAAHLKEDLSPVSIAGNIFGKIAQKAFVMKAVSKLIGITKAKIVNK